MKRFLITSLVLFVLFFSPSVVFSLERLAECDECGYCRGQSVSVDWIKNWDKCRDCLYGESDAPPNANQTLLVVEPTGTLSAEEKNEFARPIKPIPGRYYTQLGCIDTSLSTFQDPAAAGGLLNFLLTRLIFPVAGVLGFLALLYGAFLLITAQGNSMQIQIGRSYIVGSIIGLIFVFSSILLVSLIGRDILRIPGFNKYDTNIVINASNHSNGPDVDKVDAPIMKITINNDPAKTKLITLDRNLYSLKDHTAFFSSAVVSDVDKIKVEFINDYCKKHTADPTDPLNWCGEIVPPAEPAADVNIYVQSIKINDTPCSEYSVPMPTPLYSNGHSVTCKKW